MKNAYTDILDEMDIDEHPETILFGCWEHWWNDGPHGEIPNKLMNFHDPKVMEYLSGWSAYNDYGSSECYPIFVWTNKSVVFLYQYDGATGLSKIPRNPTIDIIPYMPGG